MRSTYSMKTGHISSHARQVVQLHSDSVSMTLPGSFASSSPCFSVLRRLIEICLGESGFPEFAAGQALVQRPHSVQV